LISFSIKTDISEQNFGALNFPKSNEIIVRISSLASKMEQINIKWYVIADNVPLSFLFDPF
jgi:hypothetical protein